MVNIFNDKRIPDPHPTQTLIYIPNDIVPVVKTSEEQNHAKDLGQFPI